MTDTLWRLLIASGWLLWGLLVLSMISHIVLLLWPGHGGLVPGIALFFCPLHHNFGVPVHHGILLRVPNL